MTTALLISGARGALGSALVAHFSRSAARVVAVGRGLEQAALDGKYGAGRVIAASFDVTAADAWRALLDKLTGDGLVVNGAVLAAGGWRGGAPLYETSEEVWSNMLGSNLESVRVSLQALLPGMVQRGDGSIVVIGSAASARPWGQARAAAYAAAKAASLALVQATAAEVLGRGVRVNAVLPSTIDTLANRAAMPGAETSGWVTPESLAAVTEFLLSDAARDISGAALPVYGKLYV